MSEENKTVELKENELSKVTGGFSIGDEETKYCKYCGAKKILIYQGHYSGWDEYGKSHYCNVWRCSECGNDNYYDEFSGELI